MPNNVVPMIHVPNARATVDWYRTIGFTAVDTYDDGGDGLSFAVLLFGESRVMFNSGGWEVDLYVYVGLPSAKGSSRSITRANDKFYGMREVIMRDLNRFWITFGQRID